MFSGIIEHQAKILKNEGWIFRVENKFAYDELKLGQSIAHDGACMTLTHITPEYYEFFMMIESLAVTNFWSKHVGDFFNVERCLRLGDRLDGHMVSGHVDTVWKIILLEKQKDDSIILGIEYGSTHDVNVIKKGSITLNGVSLTIVSVEDGSITVWLIPLTQKWTNLWKANIGDRVNIEYDMIGKYIGRYLQKGLIPKI